MSLEKNVGVCGECEHFSFKKRAPHIPNRGVLGRCDKLDLITYSGFTPIHTFLDAGENDKAMALMTESNLTCFEGTSKTSLASSHLVEKLRGDLHSWGTPIQNRPQSR